LFFKVFFKPLPTESAKVQTKPTGGPEQLPGVETGGGVLQGTFSMGPFPFQVVSAQKTFSSCHVRRKKVTV
jgi:hypothetical protein